MVKRIACSFAWLIAVAWGFNLANLVLGLPAGIGMVLGAAVAALVVFDPMHRIWAGKAADSEREPSHRRRMVPAGPSRT